MSIEKYWISYNTGFLIMITVKCFDFLFFIAGSDTIQSDSGEIWRNPVAVLFLKQLKKRCANQC